MHGLACKVASFVFLANVQHGRKHCQDGTQSVWYSVLFFDVNSAVLCVASGSLLSNAGVWLLAARDKARVMN